MKKRNWLSIAITIIAICACAFILLRFLASWAWGEIRNMPKQSDPLDNPPISGGERYEIDPDTILRDIENGNIEVFHFFEERDNHPKYPSGSFTWSSADYFAIAKVHHLYLTGEPAGGEWKLFAPGHFEIDQCRDDMQGFDRATIIFYKRETESFPVTYMKIYPLGEVVYSAYKEYVRIPDGDTVIENFLINPDNSFREALSVQGSIDAERALQIAEEAGGRGLRQKRDNDCGIWVTYSTDEWRVMYFGESGYALLIVRIDAIDGTYKIESR